MEDIKTGNTKNFCTIWDAIEHQKLFEYIRNNFRGLLLLDLNTLSNIILKEKRLHNNKTKIQIERKLYRIFGGKISSFKNFLTYMGENWVYNIINDSSFNTKQQCGYILKYNVIMALRNNQLGELGDNINKKLFTMLQTKKSQGTEKEIKQVFQIIDTKLLQMIVEEIQQLQKIIREVTNENKIYLQTINTQHTEEEKQKLIERNKNLIMEYEKLTEKNKLLIKQNQKLEKENQICKEDIRIFFKENKNLAEENKRLKKEKIQNQINIASLKNALETLQQVNKTIQSTSNNINKVNSHQSLPIK